MLVASALSLNGVSPTTNAVFLLSPLSATISSNSSGNPGADIRLKALISLLRSSLETIALCIATLTTLCTAFLKPNIFPSTWFIEASTQTLPMLVPAGV